VIRLATADDLPALVALEEALFGVDAWDEDAVRAELAGPGRRFVVTDDLTGYAVSLTAGDVTDLLRIGVAPPARRRGLAAALLDDLLRHTGDADRMLLEVSAGNRDALAFYESRGFSRIHVRPRYYRDGSDALVLQRSLGGGDTRSERMAP
jgi:ribosomal protein S18 acetylase RimI-like enzyme